MTQKKECNIALIAGILFAVLALRQLILSTVFSFWGLLWLAAYVVFAALLVLKKREKYAIIPCGVLLLLEVRSFLLGFKYQRYITWGYYEDEFSIYVMLLYLLVPLAYVCLLYIMGVKFSLVQQQNKEKVNSLWFVPAALMIAKAILGLFGLILSAFGLFVYSPYYFQSGSLFNNALKTIALLLTALWVVYPDGLPKKELGVQKTDTNTGSSVVDSELYCGLVKHILLLLFTFGVWLLIWIYRVTGYTNSVKDEEKRNPTTKLLLCMFVPFYQIYWTYKTAQRIDKMAAAKGLQSDLSTLCLILAIFVPIIPPVLMQDKLNNIATTGNQKVTLAQTSQTEYSAVLGTAEELKNYKELLDSGVITQEEFDAKKKQLLGL